MIDVVFERFSILIIGVIKPDNEVEIRITSVHDKNVSTRSRSVSKNRYDCYENMHFVAWNRVNRSQFSEPDDLEKILRALQLQLNRHFIYLFSNEIVYSRIALRDSEIIHKLYRVEFHRNLTPSNESSSGNLQDCITNCNIILRVKY